MTYYNVTVGYETDETDKAGNAKIQKLKYVVEAQSVEEVNLVMAKFHSGDRRSSEIVSIIKQQIDSVITKNLNPTYYQG
jgi:hypothetical protein